MRKIFVSTLLFFSICISSCTRSEIRWIEGETNAANGKAVNTIVIQNPPKGSDWCVWFAANHIDPVMEEDSPAVIERFNGCMYRIVPSESNDGTEMTIRYAAKTLPRQCWAPEGFSMQNGRQTYEMKTEYVFLPAERKPEFAYESVGLEVQDMIPALKSFKPMDGTTTVSEYPDAEIVASQKASWYRIVLDGSVHIRASDEDGAFWASVTLDNLVRNAGSRTLPNCVIEDWPDLQYRGFMLDVSRNFTSKEGVMKLIDILSHYKVNVLHLHLGDDEGWRLEIPGLPELTLFGARHCLPVRDEGGSYEEVDGLLPSYSGKIDPVDPSNSGNGFYSHEDFVEILRYAWARRMRVLPEFDSPGHGRAAIRAMEKYARRTGDESFLLSEPDDKSDYLSVQYYTDNAINVAMQSTYNFFAKVFDALIDYYAEAGAPLRQVHIGGDEVPEGAWMGSESCLKLMAENGWSKPVELKSYFVEKMVGLAEERDLKIAGWQEIITGVTPECYQRIKTGLGTINFWNTRTRGGLDELPYRYANDGINVVLSNMTNAYIDFAYNPGKLERGHSWGGFVDERRSFSLLPYDIYRSVRWKDDGSMNDIACLPEGKIELKSKENIVGVQGQLWSETIRCFDHVSYYTFPKAVGLFERAWNASPSFEGSEVSDCPEFKEEFNRFYNIILDREMPFYEEKGICYKPRY